MNVFARKLNLTPLTMPEIDQVVRSYFETRDNIHLSETDVSTDELAGLPEWTLIQLVDNYLVALSDSKSYKKFKTFAKQLNVALPDDSDYTLDFLLSVFEFHVLLRQLDPTKKDEVMADAQELISQYDPGSYKLSDLLNIYIDLVSLIQEYEALELERDDAAELIKVVISNNDKLLLHYLACRQDAWEYVQHVDKLMS